MPRPKKKKKKPTKPTKPKSGMGPISRLAFHGRVRVGGGQGH